MPKFIKQVNGSQQEEATVAVGGGANSGKVPELNGSGQFDNTMMPPGIGPDTETAIANEALLAGEYVNIYNDAGTVKCRKAVATSVAMQAHGYVLANVASAGIATIYFDESNTAVTAKTPGALQFLSPTTPGATTEVAPSTGGQIQQRLGFAASATRIRTLIEPPLLLV